MTRNNTLAWRQSSNGHAQLAPSAVTAEGEEYRALEWILAGSGDHWGLDLAPAKGAGPRVLHLEFHNGEDEAKAAAQAYENEHAGEPVRFVTYDAVRIYHLIGGGTVTQTVAHYLEPLHIGPLQQFAQEAQRELRKARRDDKVLRLVADDGIAVMPARQVAHIEITQRDNSGHYFRGEPGWPAGLLDGPDQESEMVEHLMDMVTVYGDLRAEQTTGGKDEAANGKAREALLADLREHIENLLP